MKFLQFIVSTTHFVTQALRCHSLVPWLVTSLVISVASDLQIIQAANLFPVVFLLLLLYTFFTNCFQNLSHFIPFTAKQFTVTSDFIFARQIIIIFHSVILCRIIICHVWNVHTLIHCALTESDLSKGYKLFPLYIAVDNFTSFTSRYWTCPEIGGS